MFNSIYTLKVKLDMLSLSQRFYWDLFREIIVFVDLPV
jgi:hypothetical protein